MHLYNILKINNIVVIANAGPKKNKHRIIANSVCG